MNLRERDLLFMTALISCVVAWAMINHWLIRMELRAEIDELHAKLHWRRLAIGAVDNEIPIVGARAEGERHED